MLFLCFGEFMLAGLGVQGVVEVIGIVGIQRRVQAGQTGVGNGTGGQSHVGIGVEGTVDLQILHSQRISFAA